MTGDRAQWLAAGAATASAVSAIVSLVVTSVVVNRGRPRVTLDANFGRVKGTHLVPDSAGNVLAVRALNVREVAVQTNLLWFEPRTGGLRRAVSKVKRLRRFVNQPNGLVPPDTWFTTQSAPVMTTIGGQHTDLFILNAPLLRGAFKRDGTRWARAVVTYAGNRQARSAWLDVTQGRIDPQVSPEYQMGGTPGG